jgi:ParB family chromosome partitioning protein
MDLARIQARSSKDIRPTNPLHVLDLAESIAAIGLLEPLVVDRELRLLAGGHRLAALRLLAEPLPSRSARIADLAQTFGIERGKPVAARQLLDLQTRAQALPLVAPGAVVRTISDLDAHLDPDRAFQVEVAENEKRRDYTPNDIRGVADRLRRSGKYQLSGRPGTGKKAMMPELAAIFGKSQRQIFRALAGISASPAGKSAIRQTFSPRAQRTLVHSMMGALPTDGRFDRLRELFAQVELELGRLAP